MNNTSKKILIKPVITEKSIMEANLNNKFTFVVSLEAGKIEIAKAIKEKFDVTVKSVTTINVLGKKVLWGKKRQPGKRNNYKKAIVTLKKGDKIALFDIK